MSQAGRRFPVMASPRGQLAGKRVTIPWDIAEAAYTVYASRYGRDQSLERLAERGGLGELELDDLAPNWREFALIEEPQA